MTEGELKAAVEAIIYAADEPATVEQMAAATGATVEQIEGIVRELVASYASDERGIEIRPVAGGYRFYTKPHCHEAVRAFIRNQKPPVRLSMAALETLAVIAYRQPITLPEIQEIRGVNSAGVVQTLLEKRLIAPAGRKRVIGRPILYRTTKEFLLRFGLNSLDELPSLKEFEELARAALGTQENEGIGAEISSTVPDEEDAQTGSNPGVSQMVPPQEGN
jgi:segregation and condensation protein B